MVLRTIYIFAFLLFSQQSYAAAQAIQHIINQNHAPAGVVFEIVESDRDFLNLAIPQVSQYASKLRKAYPNLSIAVVTHGKEQFALTLKNENKHSQLHEKVKRLVNNENITLHVCGTHASWLNIAPEEFPKFVDVAVAAPAQINDYRALGFLIIRLEK